MSQEIEIEFKNLLTEEEYLRMLEDLPFDKHTFTEQTNYYFETEDMLLKENGAALRIRHKGDTWTMTLKQPHPEGLLETHDTIDEQTADLWIQNKGEEQTNTSKQLKEMGIKINNLRFLGSLTTRRREIDYKNTTVTLDFSRYFQVQDYELEIEAMSKSEGESVFAELLHRYSIPERETKNKIRRFYEARVQSD
ncbi:CYTH domain-containing protein [Salimicrobium sp. PL1-032A]|uniref:CYTH domain-containing protein n=1 Tax=Salimicrobium sp. PL1-032A TaxID=3095364 RepID=UPI003261A677